MAREGQARKALETKLAERSQQLHAAQKSEAAAKQESESRAERVKALERQLQAEVEKRTQTEAKGAEMQRVQAAQLQAALGDEEETRKGLEQKLQALTRELEAARSGEEKARAQAAQVATQVHKLQDSLKAESQKSLSLREQLTAQLAGGSEATVRKLTEEVERLRADSMALKKVREELVDANRKAMESQASYMKEKRERESLTGRVSELESRPPPPAKVAHPSSDEVDKLKADVAKLKSKLVAAENAAEAAALLKSKVARLEAQLKKKG
jgi:chromosome segregation ATPase